jgi:sporulation protein YlmC with PRC-barrel domain
MKLLNRTFCPSITHESKEIHMKKLHSIAFYALTAPVITLGAGSLLAQPAADPNIDREQQSTQRAGQPGSQLGAERDNARDHSLMQNRGYLASAPANGMQSSDLIGAEVRTTGDEDVGPVDDLIIDENGQIVAIVVGVGGFLGLGEKKVAIGWDDVTMSGSNDEHELRIEATREELTSAPEFDIQE